MTSPLLGQEFSLAVFTRRWGNFDHYSLKLTTTGWHVHHMSYEGDCGKKAEPKLFDALEHDSVNYPSGLGDFLEHLWEAAQDAEFTQEKMKRGLGQLAKWIEVCETNTPRYEPFKQ